MAVFVEQTTAETILNQITSDSDAGSGPAEVEIFDGADVSLAIIVLNEPSFNTAIVDSGYVVINHNDSSELTTEISTDGTATYFELQDSAGNNVLQGDCGEDGDGAEMTLNSVNFVSGAEAKISSLQIRLPMMS